MITQHGEALSQAEGDISGREYLFEPNEQGTEAFSVDFRGGDCLISLRNSQREHRIRCGRAAWRPGKVSFGYDSAHSATTNLAAASCAWADDDTLLIKLCFYETPYCPTITCRFSKDHLLYATRLNVSFEANELPKLEGRPACPG